VFGASSFGLACLRRARASSKQDQEEAQTNNRYSFPDDSGSKLRDKEQQRLSSK